MDALDAINAINNYAFSKVIAEMSKHLPTEEERMEQTRFEIEQLKQAPEDPGNKILLEFFLLQKEYYQCKDEEKGLYLFKAMEQKQKDFENYLQIL